MYDHIYRMLEAGPGLTPGPDVLKLDRVFFTGPRAVAVTNYKPLLAQADLRDYLTCIDRRLTGLPETPSLPSATAELDLNSMLGGLSDINVDVVAQQTRYVSEAMELATLVESSCEATVRLGAALILLGFAIDRYRN